METEKKPDPKLALQSPINDFTQLETVLRTFCKSGKRKFTFSGLGEAIKAFNEFMTLKRKKTNSEAPEYDFFRDLLPKICNWACKTEDKVPSLPRLQAEKPHQTLALTSNQIRYILSNSFFLNDAEVFGMVEEGEVGFMSFFHVYTNSSQSAIHRVLCQLAYFEQQDELLLHYPENHQVVFERFRLTDFPDASRSKLELELPFDQDLLSLTVARMEDSPAVGFVDFANRSLHIHTIIPSLTQEEVFVQLLS
eukprot:TRINITY_DN1157_c0_g3_i1.p1 TRINITY_DN1157_c0_g3~~TRINITY_DN1157_c0_g3_i1.p1  ORF type:complete len:292 (+),score=82.79 TRINITY_DN1157_c0_g3_i1:124-876(+)